MATWVSRPFGCLAVGASVVLLSVPTAVHGQEQALADQQHWSATQQEVWEQEQAYWGYLSAGKIERFMALFDKEFVGWSGPGIISRAYARKMAGRVAESRLSGFGRT